MIELALLGSHADGTQLVFTDPEGKRYLVDINDDLKAAIKRQSLSTEVLPPAGRRLAPREIQRLLRAGMEPEEIASAYEIELERISRYTRPIQAEKNAVIAKALERPISNDTGAPHLGELVVDRLATRGVDSTSLQWSAKREEGLPWELHLTFVQSARQLHAHWELSESGKLQRALDDEARWLTETTAPAPAPLSTLLPASPATVGQAESDAGVDALLDELTAARGRRQGIDTGEEQPPLRMDAARQRKDSNRPGFKPTSPLNFVRYSRGEKISDNTSPNPDPSSTHDVNAAPNSGEPLLGNVTTLPTPRVVDDISDAATDPATDLAPHGSPQAGAGSHAAPAPTPAPTGHPDSGPWEGADSDSEGPSATATQTISSQTAPLPGFEQLPTAAETTDNPEEGASRRAKRAKRRSVPAWDEIIFGSRSE